jgi:hypothetical protein
MSTTEAQFSDTEKAILKKVIKKGRTATEIATMLGYEHGRHIGRPLGKLVKAGHVVKSDDRTPQYSKPA